MGTCCSKEDGPTRTTSELQRVEGSVESHAPRYKYIAGLILGKPSTFLKPGLMDERFVVNSVVKTHNFSRRTLQQAIVRGGSRRLEIANSNAIQHKADRIQLLLLV